ncbi:hypothetical protein HK102_008898, partial [Quaeritorhiza haematococci]
VFHPSPASSTPPHVLPSPAEAASTVEFETAHAVPPSDLTPSDTSHLPAPLSAPAASASTEGFLPDRMNLWAAPIISDLEQQLETMLGGLHTESDQHERRSGDISGANLQQRTTQKWLKDAPEVQRILSTLPSLKTSNAETFRQAMVERLRVHSQLTQHYGLRHKQLRQKCFIMKQRATSEIFARFSVGSEKYGMDEETLGREQVVQPGDSEETRGARKKLRRRLARRKEKRKKRRKGRKKPGRRRETRPPKKSKGLLPDGSTPPKKNPTSPNPAGQARRDSRWKSEDPHDRLEDHGNKTVIICGKAGWGPIRGGEGGDGLRPNDCFEI